MVRLADGVDAPRGFGFVAMQPLGREAACRYVLFTGAPIRPVRYEDVSTFLRSVATALRSDDLRCLLTRCPDPVRQSPLGRISGYSPGEIIGRNVRFLQGGDRDQPAHWRLMRGVGVGPSGYGRLPQLP